MCFWYPAGSPSHCKMHTNSLGSNVTLDLMMRVVHILSPGCFLSLCTVKQKCPKKLKSCKKICVYDHFYSSQTPRLILRSRSETFCRASVQMMCRSLTMRWRTPAGPAMGTLTRTRRVQRAPVLSGLSVWCCCCSLWLYTSSWHPQIYRLPASLSARP